MPPVEEGPVSTTAHAFAESYDILKKLDAEIEMHISLEPFLTLFIATFDFYKIYITTLIIF